MAKKRRAVKRGPLGRRQANGSGSAPGVRERVVARQAESFKLRLAGCTYQQIGERFGVSAMQSWRDCRLVLDQIVKERNESAEQLRALELERLDRVSLSLWPFVSKGSAEHARAMIRVSERRCRLLGLDLGKGELVVVAPPPSNPFAQEVERLELRRMFELADRLRGQLDALEAQAVYVEAPSGAPAGEPAEAEPPPNGEAHDDPAAADYARELYRRELARRAGNGAAAR